MDTCPATSPGAPAGRPVGLAVLALPALLVSVDVLVMLLALPRVSADLHASAAWADRHQVQLGLRPRRLRPSRT